MENLNKATLGELTNIIRGIVLGRDFNESIDEQYCLRFKVAEQGDKAFKITYDWYKGSTPGTGGDPQYSKDAKLIVEVNHFIINRNETFRKFTKEVIDAIDEVTAHEFDDQFEEAF